MTAAEYNVRSSGLVLNASIITRRRKNYLRNFSREAMRKFAGENGSVNILTHTRAIKSLRGTFSTRPLMRFSYNIYVLFLFFFFN